MEYRAIVSDQVERIYAALVEDFADSDDPIQPAGVRDRGLLESAVARQLTAFGGVEKYRTISEKTATLFFGICNNHPFHNGNKRCALVSMLVALDENGYLLLEDDGPLFDMVTRAASHTLFESKVSADDEVRWIAAWLDARAHKREKGERALPFRALRRILVRFGCAIGPPNNGFIDIERAGQRIQIAYHGDGYEHTQNTLRKLRHELDLDDAHGIDSRAFYNGDGQAGEFIIKYRRVLRDLAHA